MIYRLPDSELVRTDCNSHGRVFLLLASAIMYFDRSCFALLSKVAYILNLTSPRSREVAISYGYLRAFTTSRPPIS